jgi:hypothetical protein
MLDFDGAFDALADDGFWIDAAMVFGGFIAPEVLGNVVEGVGPDVPNELYGIAVAAGSEMVIEERMVTVGAGIHTLDTLATRLGIKNTVTNLGA